VQAAFTWMLIGVLVASVVSFLVMGLVQFGRTNSLARKAHQMRMKFSSSDPFDVPCRYGQFALIANGHSGRANNVTYGRLEGWPVRAFDFRYEVGHGTRRLTRHYSVVVAETELDLPPVLMWNERDIEGSPMAVRQSSGRLAWWFYVGSDALAATLEEECRPLADQGVSVQICGSTLMLCAPVRKARQNYIQTLEKMGQILRKVRNAPRVEPQ